MISLRRWFSRGRDSRGTLFLLSLLLAGCNRPEVGFYRVAKEKEPELPPSALAPAASPAPAPVAASSSAAMPSGGMTGPPIVAATGPALTWTAPASWQPRPVGAMRKGSYNLTDGAGATADLSITAFPGAVGGELANLNRWRGQLGLPPIESSALDTAVTRFSQNGLTVTLVDVVSAETAAPQRILGAMVPFEGAMWFFKLTGPEALVATAKPAFTEFVKTVKPAASANP